LVLLQLAPVSPTLVYTWPLYYACIC